MYFEDFPKFAYDFNIAGDTALKVVTDITRNVRFRKELLANIGSYDEYDIEENDTPEIIAEKVYGNPEYHWIVLLSNEKFDYISDFPMPQPELDAFVTQKYGAGNEYATHHYVDVNGYIVSGEQVGATSVSNAQYEDDVNESKRRIKIVSPKLVSTVLQNFKDLL